MRKVVSIKKATNNDIQRNKRINKVVGKVLSIAVSVTVSMYVFSIHVEGINQIRMHRTNDTSISSYEPNKQVKRNINYLDLYAETPANKIMEEFKNPKQKPIAKRLFK